MPENNQSNQEEGALLVRVSSADNAVPIAGATVAVRLVRDGVPVIISVMVTDGSGRTALLPVEAPDASLSLVPGADTPFSLTNVEVLADGYYTYVSIGVPVFSGETSILQVNLIPLPDSDAYSKYPTLDTIVNERPGSASEEVL